LKSVELPMKERRPFRFTISALMSLIALVAANCAVLIFSLRLGDDHFLAAFVLIALLPLINASALGIRAIGRGYRIKLRRRPAGEVAPFWVRFGLISGVMLCASVIAVAIAEDEFRAYFSFVEEHVDRGLIALGMVSRPIDYIALPAVLIFVWAFVSGPLLVAVWVICAAHGRYRLSIVRVAPDESAARM
jgi:hypothetical protein